MTASESYQTQLDDILPDLKAGYTAGYKPALLKLIREMYWRPIREREAQTGKRQKRRSSTKLVSVAIVLSRLDYWTQRSKHPGGVVYKSTAELSTELGLSQREIEDGTELLTSWEWVRWTIPSGRERHYQVVYEAILQSVATLTDGSEGFLAPTPTAGSEGTLTAGNEGALTDGSERASTAGNETIKYPSRTTSRSTSSPPDVRASARWKDGQEDHQNHRGKKGEELEPPARLAAMVAAVNPSAARGDDAAWNWAKKWSDADRLGLSIGDLAAVAHLAGVEQLGRLDAVAGRVAVAKGYRNPRRRPVREQRRKYWARSVLEEPGLTLDAQPLTHEQTRGKPGQQSAETNSDPPTIPEHSYGGDELISVITADASARLDTDESLWTTSLRAVRHDEKWILVARWSGHARQLAERHAAEYQAHGVSEVVSAEEYLTLYRNQNEAADVANYREVST